MYKLSRISQNHFDSAEQEEYVMDHNNLSESFQRIVQIAPIQSSALKVLKFTKGRIEMKYILVPRWKLNISLEGRNAFWGIPLSGIRLSHKLGILPR